MRIFLSLAGGFILAGLVLGHARAQTAPTATTSVVSKDGTTTSVAFTFASADLACVGRVTGQDPAAWLQANLAQLVSQCTGAERARTLATVGISGDPLQHGLTQGEVDMIVSLRKAAAASAAASAPAPTTPTTASPTATPR